MINNKTKRTLFLTFMILLLSAGQVLAYTEGQTVRYTSRVDSSDAVIFTVDGNRGYCCQVGVEEGTSGTAKVGSISSTSKLAKTMAYISKKGWDDKSGTDSTSGLPWQLVCQAMVQYANQGNTAVNYWKSSAGGSWPDATINAIKGYVDDAQDVSMPNGFKVFIADAGSKQNFAVFYIQPTGKLRLSKISSNTGITG